MSDEIEQMFAGLAVFDAWGSLDLFSFKDTEVSEEERRATRERVRRLRSDGDDLVAARRDQARVMAEAMLALRREGKSYRAIAVAFNKPLPWVHRTIKNMADGKAPPGRGRKRAA